MGKKKKRTRTKQGNAQSLDTNKPLQVEVSAETKTKEEVQEDITSAVKQLEISEHVTDDEQMVATKPPSTEKDSHKKLTKGEQRKVSQVEPSTVITLDEKATKDNKKGLKEGVTTATKATTKEQPKKHLSARETVVGDDKSAKNVLPNVSTVSYGHGGAKKKTEQSTQIIAGAGGTIGNAKTRLEPFRPKPKLYGKEGRKIMLATNHFELTIRIPKGDIFHYDVQFKPPWKGEIKRSDRKLLLHVFIKFREVWGKILADNPNQIVFDGFKNMYSCRPLKIPSEELVVNVQRNEESKETIDVKMNMKLVKTVPVQYAVEEYVRQGTTATKPNDAIQMLNIVLGMTPQLHYETIGRNHFKPKEGSVIDLGQGKSLWVGTFQSVRLGWKPFLNVEMANKVAYEECSVTDFIRKVLTISTRTGPRIPTPQQIQLRDKRDISKVEEQVSGLKIIYYRPDGHKRDYRVNKLMDAANELKIKLDNGQLITIERYFLTEYKYQLKQPTYRCLHVGDRNKTVYLPIELCNLKKQFAPRSKRLNEEEAANMIRKTALPPAEKQKRIIANVRQLNNGFKDDPFAKTFGISVSDQMARVEARVLDPPCLEYKIQGNDAEFKQVVDGKWNLGSERDRRQFQFVKSVPLLQWGVLDLAGLRDNEKEVFVDGLYTEGNRRGLEIDFPEYDVADIRNLSNVECAFQKLYQNIKKKHGKTPQLIMVLVQMKSRCYGHIKLLGDVYYRMPTQFMLKKNVLGRNGPSPQVLHNVCLKLNSKLQGTNQKLAGISRPPLFRKPVMILGADVTHSSPGEGKPSIAAVVASCDCDAAKYNCEISVQDKGHVVEVIENIEEMVKTLLKKFEEQTRQKPLNIIYYRDGVSEGQFVDILSLELSAIRRACTSISESYEPGVTFLVAQKRHKTRFFANPKDGVGKMKNVPPGTVVDTVISHPTEYDFFMASHEGIQGTTKPTHYHVLWDDNNLPPDDMQKMTFYLCHLYSRCERSVSYPAPTYYAHLAAFRAREHHNALLDKAAGKPISKDEIKKIETLDLLNYFV